MTIKARLLLAVVGGIILLFSASFYATNELNKANDDYNAEASITSYTSAWFGSLDGGYVNNLETFDPVLDPSKKSASGNMTVTPSMDRLGQPFTQGL